MTTDLPHDISGIRYSVCDQSDVPEMGRLLAATFTRNDPPAVAVGLTDDEFEAFVNVVSLTAGADRLTIIARDIASGAMAGALLAEDAATPLPEGMDLLSEKFEPIFDLFGQLDEQIHEERPIASGEVLHLFLLGVDEHFARRGIAQDLVRACLANGSEMGYRTAVTEATNRVSQHIFGKLGFVSRAECSYADYHRDGIPVFASIAGHGGPKAMVRDTAAVA
jgi:ribosomal protein S18 acetylase RimI-like enzyme